MLEQRSFTAEAEAAYVAPEGFYQYTPEPFIGKWRQSAWKPDEREGVKPTADECKAARLQRVRNKEKLKPNRTVKVRLTGKNPPGAQWKIIGGNGSSTDTVLMVGDGGATLVPITRASRCDSTDGNEEDPGAILAPRDHPSGSGAECKKPRIR